MKKSLIGLLIPIIISGAISIIALAEQILTMDVMYGLVAFGCFSFSICWVGVAFLIDFARSKQ